MKRNILITIATAILCISLISTAFANTNSVLNITIDANANEINIWINGVPLEKMMEGTMSKREFESFKKDLEKLLKDIIKYSDANDEKVVEICKKRVDSLEKILKHILDEHNIRIKEICINYEGFKNTYNGFVIAVNERFEQMAEETDAKFTVMENNIERCVTNLQNRDNEKQIYLLKKLNEEASERRHNDEIIREEFNEKLKLACGVGIAALIIIFLLGIYIGKKTTK